MTATQRKLVDDGYATVQEAAEFLRCSESRMYELVHGNVLSHAKHGGRIVVPWAAIKRYAQERLKLGSVA